MSRGIRVGGEATARAVLVVGARADVDLEELEELSLGLRQRLLELDVEDVEMARDGTGPTGAKSAGLIAVGTLVVGLTPGVLRGVVRMVTAWMEHRPVRTVTITIGANSLEVQAVSAEDQRKLIDAFVLAQESAPARDAADPGPGPSAEPDTDGAA
ncbi:hypothetical protein ACIPSA_25575 [Streptomyces sp. NPDC086549]|uniref:hypothetical protein n=1 Tax=Streptomyces sp. NPDC086549 TaxID=3365752 RepID=UPI00382DC2F5